MGSGENSTASMALGLDVGSCLLDLQRALNSQENNFISDFTWKKLTILAMSNAKNELLSVDRRILAVKDMIAALNAELQDAKNMKSELQIYCKCLLSRVEEEWEKRGGTHQTQVIAQSSSNVPLKAHRQNSSFDMCQRVIGASSGYKTLANFPVVGSVTPTPSESSVSRTLVPLRSISTPHTPSSGNSSFQGEQNSFKCSSNGSDASNTTASMLPLPPMGTEVCTANANSLQSLPSLPNHSSLVTSDRPKVRSLHSLSSLTSSHSLPTVPSIVSEVQHVSVRSNSSVEGNTLSGDHQRSSDLTRTVTLTQQKRCTTGSQPSRASLQAQEVPHAQADLVTSTVCPPPGSATSLELKTCDDQQVEDPFNIPTRKPRCPEIVRTRTDSTLSVQLSEQDRSPTIRPSMYPDQLYPSNFTESHASIDELEHSYQELVDLYTTTIANRTTARQQANLNLEEDIVYRVLKNIVSDVAKQFDEAPDIELWNDALDTRNCSILSHRISVSTTRDESGYQTVENTPSHSDTMQSSGSLVEQVRDLVMYSIPMLTNTECC